MDIKDWWLVIGFVGQLLFSARFFVQWVASERAHQSVIPVSFWYLSLAGSLTLLAYSIHRLDPVFIAGQSMGGIIYVRNLFLIKENAQLKEEAANV